MNEEQKYKLGSLGTSLALMADLGLLAYSSNIIGNVLEGARHEETPENTFGYEEYSRFKVKQNNFMVLNIGKDYDIVGMLKTAKKCQEKGISCSVVLHSKANNLGEMYDEIDMLQAFCQNSTIDLPVYLSIDEIMHNNDLNVAQKRELINAFITKCSNSNMYVGLAGYDTNLANCQEYVLDITNYDTFLKKDHADENGEYKSIYQGSATMKMELNGNITACFNLAEVIEKKNLNKEENQVLSAYYTLQEGETIETVALRYGLSVNDILNYNDKKASDINKLQVIKIPNMYATIDKNTNTRNYSYAVARGIDVSVNQENMDWERIKASSDFIIIRATSGRNSNNEYVGSLTNLDKKLEENIVNSVNSGVPFGLYFVIDKEITTDEFIERYEQRLQNCDEIMERNGITIDKASIPVFIDIEKYSDTNDYYEILSSANSISNNHGYQIVGIYANQYVTGKINSNISQKNGVLLSSMNMPLWLAGGSQYSTGETYTLDELEEKNNDTFLGMSPVIRQVTDTCTDTGAYNSSGNCDVNYLYTNGLFPIKETDNPSLNEITLQIEKYESQLKHIENCLSNGVTIPVALGVVLTALKVYIERKRIELNYRKWGFNLGGTKDKGKFLKRD